MSGSHEKLPWLFWAQLVLVAIVATLYFMNSGKHDGSVAHGDGGAAAQEVSEASKQTLKPIGDVAVSGGEEISAGDGERSGKDIVSKTCQSCHANGIANAPKLDESAKADWEARMAKGMDEVLAVAKKGKGAMPPMGTDPSLSDAELKNSIIYMLEKVGIDAGDAGSSSASASEPAAAEVVGGASSDVNAGIGATATNNDEGADAETATAPAAPSAPAAPEPPATPSSTRAETVAVAATGAGEAAVSATEPATAEAKPAIDSAKLYSTTCFACHDTGAAGAPKTGDKAAWADRIAQGKEALYKAAIKGITSSAGVMPPKGGYMNLSDDEVKAIVDHMVSKSE